MHLTPFATSRRDPWCRAKSGCGPIVHRRAVPGPHIPELYYTSGTSIWLALWLVNFSQSEAEDSVWLSRTGERYVQLLSVAHGVRSSVTNVVWGSVMLCAFTVIYLFSCTFTCFACQSPRTEDMAEWCVAIKPRSVSHLAPIFWNICVKKYRDNEHDEANTDMFQVE